MENALEKVFEGRVGEKGVRKNMSQDLLPVLAQRENMRIVEVDGQPVVTARDLARALGYAKDNAVAKIYDRNRNNFTDRDSFLVDMRRFVPQLGRNQFGVNLGTNPHEAFTDRDTFTLNMRVNPQGGDPYVRVFTKRGALKVCMKSNQPKAVMVQEALIDLYEQVERGDLVSVGYLHDAVRELKAEIGRLSRLVTGVGGGREILPVQMVYVPCRQKPHSFDDAALAFLQELFNSRLFAKISDIDRRLRKEAAIHGWRIGSYHSVYRAVAKWKKAVGGLN